MVSLPVDREKRIHIGMILLFLFWVGFMFLLQKLNAIVEPKQLVTVIAIVGVFGSLLVFYWLFLRPHTESDQNLRRKRRIAFGVLWGAFLVVFFVTILLPNYLTYGTIALFISNVNIIYLIIVEIVVFNIIHRYLSWVFFKKKLEGLPRSQEPVGSPLGSMVVQQGSTPLPSDTQSLQGGTIENGVQPRKSLWFRLFFCIFLVFGIGMIVFSAMLFQQGAASSHWPTTDGVILSSAVTTQMHSTSHGHTETLYYASIRYNYSVNGTTYTSTKISLTDSGSSDSKNAKAVVNKYSVGSHVQVYYDPSSPSTAVLKTGTTGGMTFWLLGGIIFTIVGFLGVFWGSPLFIRGTKYR